MAEDETNPIFLVFGPPPEGLDLTESTANADTAAVIVLLVLAAIAVVLRFVARVIQRNSLKMDDWTIILALVCARPSPRIDVTGFRLRATAN